MKIVGAKVAGGMFALSVINVPTLLRIGGIWILVALFNVIMWGVFFVHDLGDAS